MSPKRTKPADTCPQEADVFDLVTIGQWPGRADAGLTAHVAGCACCSDLVTVATLFRESADADADAAAVHVPDGAAVWQRAQWQARQALARQAARPVLAVQSIAAALVLAMLAAGTIWLRALLPPWTDLTALSDAALVVWQILRSVPDSARVLVVDTAGVTRLPPGLAWILSGAVGAGLVLVGVALGLSKLADSPPDSPAHR